MDFAVPVLCALLVCSSLLAFWAIVDLKRQLLRYGQRIDYLHEVATENKEINRRLEALAASRRNTINNLLSQLSEANAERLTIRGYLRIAQEQVETLMELLEEIHAKSRVTIATSSQPKTPHPSPRKPDDSPTSEVNQNEDNSLS